MENPTVKESQNKLVEAAKKVGLGGIRTQELMQNFADFFEMANQFEVEALAIEVTDEAQTEDIAKAREIRLKLKKIRVDTEKKRKELKEGIVLEGKAIDGIANIIKAVIVPTEEYLEKQEKFVENLEKERKQKLFDERTAKMGQYVEDTSVYNLMDITETVFESLLANAKVNSEARKEAEKKAEEDRIAAEKEADEKAAELKAENDKLKAEAAEKEKKLKKERAAQKKIVDEKEAVLQKERDRIGAEQRKINEEKLKLEAERMEKEAADQKILDDKAAEEKAAAMAPDKDKLRLYAVEIANIEYPICSSDGAVMIVENAQKYLLDIAEDIEDKVRGL